jgi:SAM-dependent methyltransferase
MSDALVHVDRWSSRRSRLFSLLREKGLRGVVAMLKQRGAGNAFAYAIEQLRYTLCIALGQRWDRKYGVETGGHIELADLDVVGANKALEATFVSSSPKTFRYLSRLFPENRENLTYIDVGSGKGRTLFLASLMGFGRIIGVEYSADLCAKAEQNIATFRAPRERKEAFSVVHADATEYEFPRSDLVLYFASPFKLELWHSMIENIVRSLREAPRSVTLVVTGSHHKTIKGVGRLLESHEEFTRVASGPVPFYLDTYLPYYFECFSSTVANSGLASSGEARKPSAA